MLYALTAFPIVPFTNMMEQRFRHEHKNGEEESDEVKTGNSQSLVKYFIEGRDPSEEVLSKETNEEGYYREEYDESAPDGMSASRVGNLDISNDNDQSINQGTVNP